MFFVIIYIWTVQSAINDTAQLGKPCSLSTFALLQQYVEQNISYMYKLFDIKQTRVVKILFGLLTINYDC